MPLTRVIRQAYEQGTRAPSGEPGPNYWQLRTDFTIRASLDPATHTITGTETIEVHNPSPTALDTIAIRLDHNLFLPRVQRGGSVPAETTEGMVVTRITVDGDEVELAAQRGRGGRDRGGDGARKARAQGLDQTLARVMLAQPIPAGGTASIEIDWHTTLPGGNAGRGHRMTQRIGETLFQPTQWYPRLAKYDDLRGWDSNPYLGPAEFYNNFGRFDVSLDVPAGWIVSGTGVLQNPEEVLTATARERLARVLDSDETLTIVGDDEVGPGAATAAGERLVWRFLADNVNDFAWATAEKFNWTATRATIPGRGPVPIHMVFLPERAKRFEKAGPVTRHALEFYSALWAPYPFPQLTLQDGPSAGMEYPMVINSNQDAADHETAHQWWPMMVGTNETWYGWMDEGLNEYMNILSDADARGVPPNLDGRGRAYGRFSGDELEPTMMWISNYAGPMTSFQTYSKTPMMLSMLGGIVGDEEVQRAIREYTATWAFKHPSPWDFTACMDRALGRDLGWFWYYWLFTTEAVHGAIERVTTSGTDTGVVVTVRQTGQMPSPVVLKVELEPGSAPPAVSQADPRCAVELIDDHTVEVTWPVDVWFDGRWTFDAQLDFGRPVQKVTLDPHQRFPDADIDDNVWQAGG
ncbi:MAG: M1 family metallopeptidase [Planctomycetota bacterium]